MFRTLSWCSGKCSYRKKNYSGYHQSEDPSDYSTVIATVYAQEATQDKKGEDQKNESYKPVLFG